MWTTMADGPKFSVVRLLRDFLTYQKTLLLPISPAFGVPGLLHHEPKSPWAIVQHCLYDSTFSHFGTTLICDRQMDRHVVTANTMLV